MPCFLCRFSCFFFPVFLAEKYCGQMLSEDHRERWNALQTMLLVCGVLCFFCLFYFWCFFWDSVLFFLFFCSLPAQHAVGMTFLLLFFYRPPMFSFCFFLKNTFVNVWVFFVAFLMQFFTIQIIWFKEKSLDGMICCRSNAGTKTYHLKKKMLQRTAEKTHVASEENKKTLPLLQGF